MLSFTFLFLLLLRVMLNEAYDDGGDADDNDGDDDDDDADDEAYKIVLF